MFKLMIWSLEVLESLENSVSGCSQRIYYLATHLLTYTYPITIQERLIMARLRQLLYLPKNQTPSMDPPNLESVLFERFLKFSFIFQLLELLPSLKSEHLAQHCYLHSHQCRYLHCFTSPQLDFPTQKTSSVIPTVREQRSTTEL